MFVPGTETVLVRRRTATGLDEYGNPTFSVRSLTFRNVLVAVGSSSEPVDPARDAVDVSLTLYLPNGTVILDGDVFSVRGSEWVKDGSAQEWISPFPAGDAGVVVHVRKRVG